MIKKITITIEDRTNLPFTSGDLAYIKRVFQESIVEYYDIEIEDISIRTIEVDNDK